MSDATEPPEDSHQELEQLRLVMDASQLALWDWDMVSGNVSIDDRWAGMLGYSREDLEPFSIHKFLELVHKEDQDIVSQAIAEHTESKTDHYQVEIRLKTKADRWSWVKSTGQIVSFDESGNPIRMAGVHEDVNELVLARNGREIAKSQLEAAQRLGGLGSWYLDVATGKETWSDELFRMHGLDLNSEPPESSAQEQLFSVDSWEQLSRALDKAINQGSSYELELEMFTHGHFRGWMLARGEAIKDLTGSTVGVLGVALDITERKSRETELRRKALLDPLTQLDNRSSFEMSLSQAIKRARSDGTHFALAMLDVDHFKEVNDVHGHDIGDRALVQIAERLRVTLRGGDQIFRLGGDEFVVIIGNSPTESQTDEIGSRLVSAFRDPLLHVPDPLVATISVGLALWDQSEGGSRLMRRVDDALYRAKEAGRDRLELASNNPVERP